MASFQLPVKYHQLPPNMIAILGPSYAVYSDYKISINHY